MEGKLLLEELLADHEVVDDGVVLRGSLIRSTPSATYEIEASLSDHLSYRLFGVLQLHVPPNFEVFDFGEGESSIFVETHLEND